MNVKSHAFALKIDNVVWTSSDETIATVDAEGYVLGIKAGSVEITATAGAFVASADVTVREVGLCTDEAVDMGTSVMWRNRELGAESPSARGNYYRWGSTTPSDEINQDMDKWTDPGTLNIIGTEYDAATVTLGGSWRMPSVIELEELIRATTVKWIVCDGNYGVLLTSKDTGNKIFCPLVNSSYYNERIKYSSGQAYWSGNENKYLAEGVHVLPSGSFQPVSINVALPLPIRAVCNDISTGIENPDVDEPRTFDVMNIQGMVLMRNVAPEAISNLSPGFYILRGDNIVKKIIKK